ncbi:MAG: hypothetical protein HY674_03370 [Chloroflexi bacterium]|nr:hypothetical protein [Chloroflexota bacterium]
MIENDYLRYEIGANGQNLRFIDKRTGRDYCATNSGNWLARVKLAGRDYHASSVAFSEGRLTIEFGDSGVRAVLRATTDKHYLTLEVLSLSNEAVQEFVFVDVALTLRGTPEEPFAGCALALNLQTKVPELPRPSSRLRAICYPRFGFSGAKVALIGCPQGELRPVMKEAVSAAPDLPHSPIGGPWALEAEINQGSYLFNFGNLSEQTVDDWIKLARSLGMNQIDFHGGSSFRFGDCEPNRQTYPQGRASLKAVIDRLHAAGIKAGLHTYAFFIDKKCPWVTPVPDARLAKDATFTLAEPLSAHVKSVTVAESTAKMSAVTGFFVRNSVTLQVDEELITYTGVGREQPFAFTGCQRGAWGTKAAPHSQGAKVHHLKECFGLFVPDGDSTLLSEVAARTAAAFNECGFDMMYLDALDGEDILGGGENGWHYGSKFVFELWKRLERPALMEMSTFHHHLWYVRSRLGAWDHPTRSHKKFIDIHCAANADGRQMFLPMHLGWWAVKTWTGPQGEPTFADDIEYLCGKALATDTGFSLMGVDPEKFARNPALQRLGAITRQYESLRHAKHFPEPIKARLRVPGEEFTLSQSADGQWQFRPVQYQKHKVEGLNGWSDTWTVTNHFAAQPLQMRLEALLSAEPYDATGAVTVAEFKDAKEFPERVSANGVTADLQPSSTQVKAGSISGCFTASNAKADRQATWVKMGRTYSPPLNLGGDRALGVWVHGDGQGEVLNVQLRSPEHVVGGIGEHYVVVDFAGWRYFELIEPEGERHANYAWPYGSFYDIYRESVDYKQVEKLSLWLNHLPPNGKAACYLSPIKALPLVKAKLRNPRLTASGKTVAFPVEMESGSYLEFKTMADCRLYGPDGALLQEVKPEGEVPILNAGPDSVAFACDPPPGYNPRVRVTAITAGVPLALGE